MIYNYEHETEVTNYQTEFNIQLDKNYALKQECKLLKEKLPDSGTMHRYIMEELHEQRKREHQIKDVQINELNEQIRLEEARRCELIEEFDRVLEEKEQDILKLKTLLHYRSTGNEEIGEMDLKLTRVVIELNQEDPIPVELERWFGDFPVTMVKTVKDLADWDCMGEIKEWFKLRPNDLPNSNTLQKWFHSLPLGRGRRVKDFETWINMDEERRKWFDMRPSVAKTIPIRCGMFLKYFQWNVYIISN